VGEFARKARLAHTLLLSGSAAAEKFAFDKALPTAFWIDHRGVIVRRVSGFRPGMEKGLERIAEELLRARDAGAREPGSGGPEAKPTRPELEER
jgi:hypothetical protein